MKNSHSAEQATLIITTQPNDANQKGDIFGGWLMSNMDIAGAIAAKNQANGSIATVAVNNLQFINPLFVGDLVSFYTTIKAIGKSSITVDIKATANRHWDLSTQAIEIGEAEFVYVAISEPGIKRQL